MIFDHIRNLPRYAFPQAQEIAAFLSANDPLKVPVGEVEIQGRELFVRPMEYETKASSEGKFETHRLYADLQFVADGAEVMQMALPEGLAPVSGYDAAGDYQFFRSEGKISEIDVPAGHFAFFYPGEAHRPCCHSGGKAGKVKKLVFKIRMK